MTAVGWSDDELARIGAAEELKVAPLRADGRPIRPVTIWVVRVGDELYVRSWRGDDGAWYRAAKSRRQGHVSSGGVERDVEFVDADDTVNDSVDAAYRDKYARYPSYVEPMVTPRARSTTLELRPLRDQSAAS
jgi:hypothetical protein